MPTSFPDHKTVLSSIRVAVDHRFDRDYQMSFWINYTGRRDQYPFVDGMTNRGRLNQTIMPETKKRHNKQHDARAASFKRIAKAIRKVEKRPFHPLAKIFDDEAKLLRAMQ